MTSSDNIAGLGGRATFIRAAPNALQLASSQEERAILHCVGAGAKISDVLALCGLPEAKAVALLVGLRLKNLVSAAPTQMTAAPPPPAPRPAHAPSKQAPPPAAPIDAAALAEKVDLDDARKREILELESLLDKADHFSLLGVAAGTLPADCKKAYYELTKKLHPDRFFGKNLGSYKGRIDKIFKRITDAQSVLSDPAKRQAYLAEHPELNVAPPPPSAPGSRAAATPGPSAPAAPSVPGLDPAIAAQRAAERRARLARHPYLSKAVGRPGEVHSQSPEGVGRAEATPQTEADKMKARAAKEAVLGAAAEKLGDLAGAIAHYKAAVVCDPSSGDHPFHIARLLFKQGGEAELKDAHQLARKATELAPDNVQYRLLFAKILSHAGLSKNAVREFEVVLKADPSNVEAKDGLKALKGKL